MPDRADRIQSQSFDAHRKCTQRGLTANLDLTRTADWLVKRCVQLAIFAFATYLARSGIEIGSGSDWNTLDFSDPLRVFPARDTSDLAAQRRRLYDGSAKPC